MIKNKSKPMLFLSIVLMLAKFSQAQTINVKQSNVTHTAYALGSVRKLTFLSGNLSVHKTDNTTSTFALSGLKYVNFNGTTSIEEQTFNAVNIKLNTYPNPVEDLLNIEVTCPDIKNASISIISIEGKVLLTEQVNCRNSINLNLSQLAQGVYVCQYKTDKTVKATKLIKH